ncbi:MULTISPECIES: LAGLIDADG family homing endonuclease [Streptomyces]|uniref:LAGLIDADG family homing endonuclease n=1 Tax=Streptomyces TaxID=1883 RepID=UPI00093D669A|nr:MULTISPECIES: LAGLIDADG family homing endonuclease [Streptomyces]MBX9424575.1 LAGLIDADG family homing endonuclease [Streptomyces lateritius]OKJ57523.1 hypothetical protein AMK29_27755 [Streptomyces sp. CB02261]
MAAQDPSAPALFDVSALTPSTPSFMDLTDPKYAYMFGFLQADGHLSQGTGRKGRLTAEINARDIHILHEFQRLTPYNSSITERTRSTNFSTSHHSAIWTLCSLEARTTLNRLGLPYGKKSSKITPPRIDFSRRDYLRGVIDADGSVGYTGQGLPFVSLTTASTAVGAYLCHYAKKLTGTERLIKRNKRDSIYNVLYTKEAAVRLAEHLYYPGCLALERKRSTAESLSSWVRPEGMAVRAPGRRWKDQEDRILLDHGNAATAAEALGRSEHSCSLRLWRLRTGRVAMPPEASYPSDT